MTVEAHAKLNLNLRVTGRRDDGFHGLESVVQPITLCDVLTFTPADQFSTDTGYADDLILKSARVLGRQCPSPNPQPCAIHVEKRIPSGGGLGGGSADAAATLLALNELWALGRSPEELAEIGAMVGSDVPALVLANHYRQPVLMQGRGEKVSQLSSGDAQISAPNFPFYILLNPGVHSSTPAVYAKFDEMCDLPAVRSARNQLQPPAVELCPKIGEALKTLESAGARDVMMTGSGATVFGGAETKTEAQTIASRLADSNFWVTIEEPYK